MSIYNAQSETGQPPSDYAHGQYLNSPAEDPSDCAPVDYSQYITGYDSVEPASPVQGQAINAHSPDELTPSNIAALTSYQPVSGAEAYEATSSGGATSASNPSGTQNLTTKTLPERNRAAARKHRQKVKQTAAELQRREKELSQQNELLRSHVGDLRGEIVDLKNEILKHSGCDCSVIRDYIAKVARCQSD
ncbi:hypothetical protein F5Y03DRAFT_317402 [Xylaria venustula]|nr:hypothetical protein F5Y03DRAFT_317402 [Xylaria venustula]